MAKKLTLAELLRMLDGFEEIELEDVTIHGDIELEFGGTAGISLPPALAQALQGLLSGGAAVPRTLAVQRAPELLPAGFQVARAEWPGKVEEVTIGATAAGGGTRDRTVTLGGAQALPFYRFDAPMPHPPVISLDCFDMPVALARAVRVHYEDVMEDPCAWAKKNVQEFGAEMVTIHLISTDPMLKDTPAREAAKTVEEVLQAVKVPLIIGGSGNPEKDPEVLEAAAEAAAGERCLIASANLNMDYARVAQAAMKYGHVILSWTQLDINAQKTLNRYLFKLGVPREAIVIDPTTAALGYGLDYAFTNIERMRIAALKGDTDLAFPISCGITNAWGAREAWMKDSPLKEDSSWGPAALRGPLYELVTGATLALAGGDLFMMMHPTAAAAVKRVTQQLFGAAEEAGKDQEMALGDWVTWNGGGARQ